MATHPTQHAPAAHGATPRRAAPAGGAERPRRRLAVLFAALAALALVTPAPAQRAGDGVRVEVLEGRARLVGSLGVEVLYPHARARTVAGPAFLEVRPGARARAVWPGRGSVLLQGPVGLEWRPADGAEGDGEDVLLSVAELGAMELEVRRGAFELQLPGAWTTRVSGAAIQLVGSAAEVVELRHHAGAPLRLLWLGDPAAARPPVDVPAGSGVHLALPRHAPPVAREEAARPPWPAGAETWPWRLRSDTPAAAAARLARPERTDALTGWASQAGSPVTHVEVVEQGAGRRYVEVGELRARGTGRGVPTASVRAAPQAVRVAVRPDPAPPEGMPAPPARDERVPTTTRPAPAAPAPAAPATPAPAAPATPAPAAPATPAPAAPAPAAPAPAAPVPPQPAPWTPPPAGPGTPEPSPVAPEPLQPTSPPIAVRPPTGDGARDAFDPRAWRGLRRDQLQGVGCIAAPALPGVEVRALARGRVRVLVSADRPEPVWCFGPARDVLLAPGATVVFEADGSERMHLGAVLERAEVRGRVRWDQLSR